MTVLKLEAIGNSTGILLLNDGVSQLHLEEGDNLYLVETPNGFMLTPYGHDFEHKMETARKTLKSDNHGN